MYSKVRLSSFSTLLSGASMLIILIGCVYTFNDKESGKFILLLILLGLIIIFSMMFAPVSISADEDSVTVRSLLRRFRLPMSEITSIRRYKPTRGSARIVGSGGFMGYWGIFAGGDVGRYKAFYGKSSDCFMIELATGEKYMLGCENPEDMMSYIETQIKKYSK